MTGKAKKRAPVKRSITHHNVLTGATKIPVKPATLLFLARYSTEFVVVRAINRHRALKAAADDLHVSELHVEIEWLQEEGDPGIVASGDAGS